MESDLLGPLGRAEPDDVQGWMEQGGFLGLQRALTMEGAALRAALNGIQRRDGRGGLALEAGQPACVNLTLTIPPDLTRLLLEELPAWVVEGAIVLALACEQRRVLLHLHQAERAQRELLAQVLAGFTRLGFLGEAGWTGGLTIDITQAPAPAEALDSLTTYLLPFVLWRGRDFERRG